MISLSSTVSRVVLAFLFIASAFGVSHAEQTDLSTLLSRFNDLESKVETLKDEVVALTTELQSQNELIMSLEALVTRSRFLADDKCQLTFANDTGTPTCSVAYQLIAESGLEVVGDASFETAQFTGSVIVEDTVEFLANVTFQDDANMTFNGRTVFNNFTSFNKPSTFDSDVEFNNEVSFYEDVFFEDGADVSFKDTVVFFDDVTIDGPSRGTIIFEIKDRVDVKFRQSRDMIVETATTFSKNVKITQKACSGKGSDSCSNTVPTLLVAGDITGESNLIVEGELQADDTDITVRSLTASNSIVSQGGILATTSLTVSGLIEATGDIVAAGLIKGGSLESTSTIIAAGDITSTVGVVSPVDLTNEDITVNSLTASTTIVSQGTIKASGDIITDTNFVDNTP